MTIRVRTLVAIFAVLVLAGLLAAVSGVFPLGASSGHWALTRWLVTFTKERTVKARSSRIEVPPLDDPMRVLRGAGHFDIGCRPCHGAPGSAPPRTMSYMLPPPPPLSTRVPLWEPEELFWIVKNGLKFTGMPGWPTQERDDEVWDMVAFLRELPGMEPVTYRALAGLDRTPPPDAPASAKSCTRCHGVDGRGRGGASPKLAGQSSLYIYCALRAYSAKRRFSGTMETVAASLSEHEMKELSRHFSVLPAGRPAATSDPSAVSRGAEIARRGVPRVKLPSCADCHGPNPGGRRPNYPHLAGQYPGYLTLQLELLKNHHRGGSPYAKLMEPVARHLTKAQMEDVVSYYASLAMEEGPTFDEAGFSGWDACGVP